MTSQWLRCAATDPDGYRCVRVLSHQGSHLWQRCEWTDPDGNPCFLPPGHPGDHELAWFARPTAPGATHTVQYRGDLTSATAEAEEEAQELAFHHWFPASQTYAPGSWGSGAWALAILGVLVLVGIVALAYMVARKPAGQLVVVYEYQPFGRSPDRTG